MSWRRIRRPRKKRALIQALHILDDRAVILAEDETDLLLFPPLRNSWSPIGHPLEVLLSGQNARRTLFGAMNVRTGSRLAVVRTTSRSADFQAFLALIHYRYRGWHPVLLLDSDSCHTALASQEVASIYDITLQWLPKRSPQLNPMDHLWRYVKGPVLANRQFATIDELVAHTLDALSRLTPREALLKAGVLSPDFWLKTVL